MTVQPPTTSPVPTFAPVTVLEAQQISWHAQGEHIVHQVSLQVRSGEMLGLIGPNGSGKSTLLRLLSGVLRPETGGVLLGGQALQRMPRRSIARQLAYVAQSAHTQDAITAWDAVALGRTPWRSVLQPLSDRDQDIVQQSLSFVGLQRKARSAWHTLSGGERQRAHIARALAQQPQVLLLDEPTNHLDVHQQLSLMQLVQQLPITKVIALHDLNQALACDRLAVMHQGQLVHLGTPNEVLTPALLRSIFQVQGHHLIDPSDGSSVLRLRPLSPTDC